MCVCVHACSPGAACDGQAHAGPPTVVAARTRVVAGPAARGDPVASLAAQMTAARQASTGRASRCTEARALHGGAEPFPEPPLLLLDHGEGGVERGGVPKQVSQSVSKSVSKSVSQSVSQ